MRLDTENSAFYSSKQQDFNFKKLFNQILRRWKLFAVFLPICLLIAWLYNHYSSPDYSVHSSLVINEYQTGIKQFDLNQGGANNDRSLNLLQQDHPGRLKSHILSLNTLKSLGWNVFWYQKTVMYNKDLYNKIPYQVILRSNSNRIFGMPIWFKQLNENQYQIEVNSPDANNVPITFKKSGEFGKVFNNGYLNFILEKEGAGLKSSDKIFFEIYDLDNLAKLYQSKLKVLYNEKLPDIMELIFSTDNAQRGVDFLNQLEKTYIDFGLDNKNKVAENTIRFIDNQLKNVTDSLSYSENRFTNFRTRTQAIDLTQESGLAMTKRENLESEKAVLESRLQYLRNLRDQMEDSKQLKQVVLPSVYGINDQSLNNLVTKLIDLYSRREVLSFSVQEKAPSFIALNREIQTTHDNLAQNINAFLIATENDLNIMNRRVGGATNQLSLLPRTEQQLSSLKRSFDLNQELYTYLLKMRAESAITYASNQPDVNVLDPAKLETVKKTGPMTMINYLLALILGLSFPLCIIWFNNKLRDIVQSKEDLEENIHLPIVGMISHNKTRKDWVVLDNPRSNITESFRLLRTNLKFMLNGNEKKVIAVQSTNAGEGKSFISTNLASILAMNNLKVLLVGVDMRMSKLNLIFQKNNKKGLSTFLSKQHEFDEVVENTSINNLFFVSSGPIPPNPAELLENGNFEKFLDLAKAKFDYIILDNPPVSLVADGIITGRHADINLFVIRLNYSSREQIKLISNLELNKTVPRPAIVVNDVIQENYAVGHYYHKRIKGYYAEA